MAELRQHRVSRIYVIETLGPGDLRSGRDLFEATFAQRTQDNRDFAAALGEAPTKSDFLACLDHAERECREQGWSAMLHIDGHGNADGLELPSGEFMPWAEMKEAITAINVACKNNLVVVLAACRGIHLISIVRAYERAAAFAIISTAIDVSAGDVQVSFRAMYEEMFRSRDGDLALRRLNDAFPNQQPRYGIVHSETMFIDSFQGYVNTYLTPEKVVERTERLERENRESPVLNQGEMLDRRAAGVRKLVDGLKERFEEDRARFFMADLDPANRDRFPVKFEQITMPPGLIGM